MVSTNFTNVSNIEIKTEKEYYTSYYDVFNETCDNEKDKKRMFKIIINVKIDNL